MEFAGVRDGAAKALCGVQWRSNGVDALPACGEYMSRKSGAAVWSRCEAV